MAPKRKLCEYMESLTLVETTEDTTTIVTVKKSKKQMRSVHCQTEEKIYTESDIKLMLNNYINYNKNIDSNIIKTNMWVKSF